jgi:hypothetical protein
MLAAGKHPVPSRTRKLSPPAPMVLHWGRCGRVGHRQENLFFLPQSRQQKALQMEGLHHLNVLPFLLITLFRRRHPLLFGLALAALVEPMVAPLAQPAGVMGSPCRPTLLALVVFACPLAWLQHGLPSLREKHLPRMNSPAPKGIISHSGSNFKGCGHALSFSVLRSDYTDGA